MQAKERRQVALLVLLLAVLVLVVWWQLGGAMSPAPGSPAAVGVPRTAAQRAAGRAGTPVQAGPIVVHLAWLDRPMPDPAAELRDPFVFGGGRQAAEPTPAPGPASAAEAGSLEGPPEPPPPPPIPYRFIGLLDAPGTGQVAVLSDGRFVYHGREGDIIDGRYRLVSVSSASVQLEYLDGRGRQTIRLSGS